MTIILIAYGEVLWFGGHVTGLTLVSFALMVRTRPAPASRRVADYQRTLQVLSSLTAAYSDISRAFGPVASSAVAAATSGNKSNIGYAWMIVRSAVMLVLVATSYRKQC